MAQRNNQNVNLWKPILEDIEASINFGGLTNIDVHRLLRSLYAVKLLEPNVVDKLVDYVVKRGYDSDDLLTMSKKNAGHRTAVQFIWLIADSHPKLKNKHFFTHVS